MDTTESQRHRGIVNRSAPTATIVSVLIYEDVGKAIDWLCGAFGFTERLRAGRDGRVTHAQLSVGECAVMLGAQGAEFRLRVPMRSTCGWRIVISPIIPYDSPPCYHSSMRHLFILFIHLIAVLTQLFQPGGVRSLVAESVLLKHQLL
jgi:hypothetical protein